MVDNLSLSQEAQVNYKLHSFASFQINGGSICIEAEKADLYGDFAFVSAGVESISETDKYYGLSDEVAAEYMRQYHLSMDTNKAKRHTIVSLFSPVHKGQEKCITYKIVGQNNIHFNNNGTIFDLTME